MLLVAGASGFLGRHVMREGIAARREVVGAVHRESDTGDRFRMAVDLSDRAATRGMLQRLRPAWVINCAGFTNVDECERDPGRAHRANVDLPGNLAAECADAGIGLVHISTDSVFDGRRGNYIESDQPAPVNQYGRSKLEGEIAVLNAMPEALVLRTNFVGASESGSTGLADWITTKLAAGEKLQGFTDVVFAPLLAGELARIIFASIDSGLSGVFHASASDACSKYEFAVRLGDARGLNSALVEKATIADAHMTAPRPLNTSLSPLRLEKALGRTMPDVDAAIRGYSAEKKSLPSSIATSDRPF